MCPNKARASPQLTVPPQPGRAPARSLAGAGMTTGSCGLYLNFDCEVFA